MKCSVNTEKQAVGIGGLAEGMSIRSVKRNAESFRGHVIGTGIMVVSRISNPLPDKVYGWIVPAQDGPDYVAVLGTHLINTPLDAVRAWILADAKGKRP
jgi:hypothetical protein